MSGMYQTTFFEAASSSMVRWMRPSNSPNHFCPAIRSAPLASKTLQPCRSSRRPSSLRNEVLPTRTSPLTSSERGCAPSTLDPVSASASAQYVGSTSTSLAAACQKRPNVARKARSMLNSLALSSAARSSLANGWLTRARMALMVSRVSGLIPSRPGPNSAASPRLERSSKCSRKAVITNILSRHHSRAERSGLPAGGRGSATV